MRALILLSTLFLVACASTRERDFNPALCEGNLAYQAGFNDGREGYNMNSGFIYGCRDDLREKALAGYKDGFDKGHADHEQEVAENRKMMMERERMEAEARARAEAQAQPPPVIGGPVVVLPGGSIGGGGYGGY